MEKLIDAIAEKFYDYSKFDRDAIRLLIAEYAVKQYQDGYQDARETYDTRDY